MYMLYVRVDGKLPTCCITTGISVSDVCPDSGECGVAPHSVEHLFNCQSHPTQLTVGQPGCGRRLPQPGQLIVVCVGLLQ